MAVSCEKEIEARDTCERILKEFDLLNTFLSEESEWLEDVHDHFETIRKEATNGISTTTTTEQNVN